jgi:hypothetical protein
VPWTVPLWNAGIGLGQTTAEKIWIFNISIIWSFFDDFFCLELVWSLKFFILDYNQNLLLKVGIGLVKMSSEENIGKRH